ncbi:hypothetical protein [Spiroplasma endosymbiont of Danaus chrysippus]|uniref:hypothetical protein n=1 Tax=Spiroplasma endosymbiont of Danaus chrysippus TaxID=2691041 RepID=UPI00157AFC14|nr:hypothetical protein [Spiroplasma endosymbiont of Danaus chrysippus]
MKYFNPNYWFKLWLLITPLFNNQLQNTNAKAIYNKENIKDWKTKNISIRDCTQSNDQDITCIHEAGHTTIILDSKFKNKFQKLEFITSDSQYLGRTISDELIPLNQIKNISDNDLYTLLRIDLAGFAAESMFFDSNPLKYIIGQARIMDSSDLQHYHNIYQEEFESRKLKPHNEEPLNFIGKQLNETRKIINNKLEFEKILKTCCLINYVNKEHADYILKHKEIPIPLFKKEEIKMFTTTQIQTFIKEQIETFTESQIKAITSKQITWLTSEQIQTLTEKGASL